MSKTNGFESKVGDPHRLSSTLGCQWERECLHGRGVDASSVTLL